MSEKKIYLNPEVRHEFVLFFDATNSNPNGDPDAGGIPRVDPETMRGLTTDVMIKRKIRDYVALVHSKPIYIQSQVALNTLIHEAFTEVGVELPDVSLTEEELGDDELLDWLRSKDEAGVGLVLQVENRKLVYSGDARNLRGLVNLLTEGLEEDQKELSKKLESIARRLNGALKNHKKSIEREDRENARKKLCEKYFDIRMFGAVLSTGLNAGQVRGPVQFTFARSADPVLPLNLTITRQARTTIERMATGTTEVGRKPIIPYGLYRTHGFYNPYLAKTTGITREDLEILYDALENLFEFDRSASRGEMRVQGLAVFTHSNAKGKAPAHRLFKLIDVRKREEVRVPRSFDDYVVIAPKSGSLEAYGWPGVTLSWLVEPEHLVEPSCAGKPSPAVEEEQR